MKKKIQKILPNSLTVSRFLAIPLLIAGFYMSPYWSFWPVAAIFLLASITDFLDGYLARHWSTQSKFGALMDPIADKIVVVTTIVLLIYFRIIDNFTIIPAIVIICREVFVSALREFMAKEGVSLRVMGVAKIKTTTQMVAILALIVGNNKILFLNIAGSIALWAATFLSVYSAAIYYAKRYN